MSVLIPAILTDNVPTVHKRLKEFERLDTPWVHIDIMDGLFVDTRSVQPKALSALQTSAGIEFHLMTAKPEKYFADCVAAGARRIIFHYEATDDVESTIQSLNQYNVEKAIALTIDTPAHLLEPFLNMIDMVLLMSVVPGRQGQKFQETSIKKIPLLRNMKPGIAISMDGGINKDSLPLITPYKPHYYVIGSALINSGSLLENYTQLSKLLSI